MRQIILKVIARSKRNIAEEIADGTFRVHVTSPPVDGEANKKVIEVMAEFFKVRKGAITIVRGHTSSTKTLNIEGIE